MRFAMSCLVVLALSTGALSAAEPDWGRVMTHYRRARVAFDAGDMVAAGRHYARAAALPPDTPAYQRGVLERINEHRRHAMLPPVMPDPRVARAAQAHADYLAAHTASGALSLEEAHRERPGRRGFTGERPGDRLIRQGFAGHSAEVVTEVLEPGEAVDHLVNTVYHRTGILRPRARLAGVGRATRTVVDLAWDEGADAGSELSVYPGPGQEGLPPRFPGGETPEPLPGRTYPVGTPISLVGAGGAPAVSAARLRGPEGEVPLVVLTGDTLPRGDLIGDFVFLVPERPLTPETRYEAAVNVARPGGTRRLRWAFTTGSSVPGEELWSVVVTALDREPLVPRPGQPMTFRATLETSRPGGLLLAWLVDGRQVAQGPPAPLTWTPTKPGVVTVEARATWPERPGAYGRRIMQFTVPDAQGRLPAAAGTVRDPGGRDLGVKLDLSPEPPWDRGAQVSLTGTTTGIEGPVRFTFTVDGAAVPGDGGGRAVWSADGALAHVFTVTAEFEGGRLTRTLTLRPD